MRFRLGTAARQPSLFVFSVYTKSLRRSLTKSSVWNSIRGVCS